MVDALAFNKLTLLLHCTTIDLLITDL